MVMLAAKREDHVITVTSAAVTPPEVLCLFFVSAVGVKQVLTTSGHPARMQINWRLETELPWKAYDCSLALRNEYVVIAGGWDGRTTSDVVAAYDLMTHSWVITNDTNHSQKVRQTLTLLIVLFNY